ncbi:hypothetical protein HDU91_004068 [Kappamyces sp. JEL0680]|nr:hypothetical protein HDU91_004068 [Kappamyces sp. JEL0680]
MPINFILKMIAFPAPKQAFLPTESSSEPGRMIPPRISERIQREIRQTCVLAGIDPLVANLPPLEPLAVNPKKILAKGNHRLKEKLNRWALGVSR